MIPPKINLGQHFLLFAFVKSLQLLILIDAPNIKNHFTQSGNMV